MFYLNYEYETPTGEIINICASASHVTDIDIYGLEFEAFDCNMNTMTLEFNQEVFDDIEQKCHEVFYQEQYGDTELFNSRSER